MHLDLPSQSSRAYGQKVKHSEVDPDERAKSLKAGPELKQDLGLVL